MTRLFEQVAIDALGKMATWESERPAHNVSFDEYVTGYAHRFGRNLAGFAFAVAVIIGALIAGDAWLLLLPFAFAAAAHYAGVVYMLEVRAAIWDDNNWQVDRVEGVPIDRAPNEGRAPIPKRTTSGAGELDMAAGHLPGFAFYDGIGMGKWNRLDFPSRRNVRAAFGMSSDDYTDLIRAMVDAGYWTGSSATGYEWTPQGDEWRGKPALPQRDTAENGGGTLSRDDGDQP